MSLTEEQQEALKDKYEHLKEEGTPLERLRAGVMSRGVTGIKTIGVLFRRIDQNGDKKLHFYEFDDAINEYGIEADAATKQECFNEMDIEGNGVVSFDEFLIALRPPLSESRLDLINQAFDKLDASGTGEVTVCDLKGVYSADYHPKFQSGEWTEEEVFQYWLQQFGGDEDGTVSREDFVNYYVGVSSSIDDDDYFVEMMKSAWKF
ncbi:hypothetical protein CAPTEDRAFT_222663 [Capitella teleta]|uniref:EF-hand domain-containing protein n=1 Tax=Capitella teleta TaxID=283909 RepID=R7TNE2_CAPTE|nr:hypothetical protein CAPTEDRAFT_222663 [Capitella teleta]|eukprot:ELT95363.1 hypothetical protein CAPTEDRAFT_222663 [Capitella teleta]